MPNEVVSLYRKYLADTGQQDDTDDYTLTQQLGEWASRSNPALFDRFPSFGQEYGAIREANAPSVAGEFGRALKSGSQGLASTALGGLSLLTGSDYLRDKAESFEQDAAANAPTIPSLEDIAPGRRGLGSLFSKDAARYAVSKLGSVAPSIGEAVVTGAAGAALGSAAAPGPGTVAGAAEGVLARGLVKSAIKSLLKKGAAEALAERGLITEASEAALEQAVRQSVPKVTDLVGREAMAIGAKRGLAATNLANSFLLNAGDVYSEGADRPTTIALGLISAVPDSVLPTYVLGRLFPGVAKQEAKELAKSYIADRAMKVLKGVGIVGGEGATEYFQEGVNVVARNLKEGKDPLTFTDADRRRFREAGIAGAFGGALAAPTEFIEPKQTRVPPGQPARAAIPAPVAPVAQPAPAPQVVPSELAAVGQARTDAAAEIAADQASGMALARQMAGEIPGTGGQPTIPGGAPATVQPASQPNDIARQMAGTIPEEQIPLVPNATEVPAELGALLPAAPRGREISASAPVSPENFSPVPATTPTPEELKAQELRAAVNTPGVTYQYTLFRPGEGIPEALQIDVISPDKSESLASSSLEALRALGVDLPDVPADLKQGRYTVEQVRAAAPAPAPVQTNATPAEAIVPQPTAPAAPVAFEHGAVIEGEPSLDFRNTPAFQSLNHVQWAEAVRHNMLQGERGNRTSSKSDSKIAVAMRAPDGRIIVTGATIPARTLDSAGGTALKEVTLQRMGIDQEGNRVVQSSGNKPALLREAVIAGFQPIAVLHFSGEPGKIHQIFADEQAFDKAWGATEKTQGRNIQPPAVPGAVISTAHAEAQLDQQIEELGNAWLRGDAETRAAIKDQIEALYAKKDAITRQNQSMTGDMSPPEFRSQLSSSQVIDSGRNAEFQRVVANLQQLGMRVDLFSREMLAQSSQQIIDQRIAALQQQSQQTVDPVAKAELDRRIAVLQERAAAVNEAAGVTYSPWHVALAMQDVANASSNNLVTLLHEAAESLSMRLPTAQRGAVRTAIDRTIDTVRARAAEASTESGVPLARESSAHDLMAETLAQEMAAAGVDDPSLAQAILRWVKDVYYRTAMALQAAFGGEPNPDTALAWYENQLRREVLGDYNYAFGNLFGQFLPSGAQEKVRRFDGRTSTPDGIADFWDPVSGTVRQPQVDTLNRDALNWNLEYQLPGNPGAELEIPDVEARARIKGSVINGLLEFYTKLKADIAPAATWEQFFEQIKRSAEEDPRLILADLEQKVPGAGAARIGGERMTEPMNREASVELWGRLRKLGLAVRRKSAQSQQSVAEATKQITENANDINRMEADVKNAALHEDRLRDKAREMVRELARSIARGRSTAQVQGALAESIRQVEGLLESDPIPDAYRNVLSNLLDGTTPVFEYIRAIANLDLPLSEMTTKEVVDAIRGGAEIYPALANLTSNRPLMVALATLARKNADQVDQIQLGWLRDTSRFREINDKLKAIKTATSSELRAISKQFNENRKATGLLARLQQSYLAKRRRQEAASQRIAANEERIAVLDKAAPIIDERTAEAAQAAGGAQYEWRPEEGAVWTAMRQDEEGNWKRSNRVLRFNPDGSAVDGEQLRQDIQSNLAWLRARAADEGKPAYNRIAAQTYALKMLDLKGLQQRTWNSGILNSIDRFVRTPIATARTLGGPSMQRIIQMINRYAFILKNYARTLETPAAQWQAEFVQTRNASGLKDNGDFINQVFKPAMYFLSVNPGLEEGPAIRQAVQLVRRGLANPSEDFNERMAAFLRRTKTAETELLKVAEQYGVFVQDKRLGPELRRAVPKGWLTGMRNLNGGVVDVVTKDMQKAGWKLAFDEVVEDGKVVKKNIHPATFEALDPALAADPDQREARFENLANTEALDALLQKLFTPEIIGQWLEPFIRKPGQEPFSHAGEVIPQDLVGQAWDQAAGNVLRWIDLLGQKVGTKTDKEGNDPVALFRLSMLRNLDQLFGHEARLAYDASQVPGLLDPHGAKPHALMDARVSDLLPPEHVDFSTYEPETMHRLLARIAYHGSFGRNAKDIQAAFREMMNHLRGQQAQFNTLASLHTSKSGRVAEAVARGWNYNELENAARRYREAQDFQSQLEGVLGVSGNSGPLGDMTKAMAVMNFVTGQIVDNPKTAAYNLLSPAMRPFAQRSLGPRAIANTAKTYADILQTGLGSLFQTFGLHLFKGGKYASTIGNAEGRAFSNLPYGVIMSDIGNSGDNQSGAEKWMVKPLKIMRSLQRKGVQLGGGEATEFPRMAPIPGLGVMNSISQIEVQAGGARMAQEFEQLVKEGIDYMAAHPDAANNPSFRFKPSDLYKFKLDQPLLDWWREKTVEYNMGNLEDIVRDAAKRSTDDPRSRLLTDEQALQLSLMNQTEFSGNSSIATTPSWLMTSPFFRMTMPLLRWPLWMMSAVHEAGKPRPDENAVKPMLRAIGTLALWNLPIGLAFSILMDEYDKRFAGRKSNLPSIDKTAAIPLVGLPVSLLRSKDPLSLLEAMLVRSARAGNIYGLGADVAAQTFASLDPATGQRAFSLDQRVLAMSQFLNLTQALNNWVQGGEATWGGVGRPVVMAVGGNGVLHSVDIANNLLGLDNAQSRLVQRASSSNWIRSAAQELDIEVKKGAGAGTPTPLSTQSRQMYLAALANDRAEFLEAYRKALNIARENVADSDVPGGDREREARNRVLASWRSRNPFSVLAAKPSESQVRQMLSIMEPEGQVAVRDAMARFNSYSAMIEPTPVEKYFQRQQSAQRAQYDPSAMQRRMSSGSLLFSTR